MTQITAEALGVDAPHVRFEMGSSDLPSAPITAGSMTAASVGSAVAQAAGDLRAKLLAMAKADQESPLSGLSADQIAVAGGRLTSREDPGRVDTYAALLQRARLETLQAEATTQLAVRGEAKDQECRGGQADDTACYAFHSFGAQFAEVEVDPDTMEVRVTRFVGAFDVGLVLNPTMARSQGLGAITMGIGMALMEEGVRDPRNGRIVTRNLADYHVPVNADVPAAPDIEVMYIDRPDPHFNVLGCRGLAELPIVGVAAAVTNAVFHATGKRVRALPVTPDKLL